ncbi:hypothetical protein TRFO_38358 [Tritrichomonas foetus]|uniref:Uncharacterized protein n=1 Tax=Tritrichomonas foetus TaxID=1144522 RepID=A0A1J4JE33_9EUKA|nr:hypothetical protein TRFO_38358 [Tritrichomonas foetus]|eukprot:OHS95516.1 hypothetical protein TRFO_38358 [Tritrichomonas foetus]
MMFVMRETVKAVFYDLFSDEKVNYFIFYIADMTDFLDEQNPFTDLIKHHTPTTLDNYFDNKKHVLNRRHSHFHVIDPVIVIAKTEKLDSDNVGLECRRSSFSSLSDATNAPKKGNKQSDHSYKKNRYYSYNSDDPIIVFDSQASDPDEPIGLKVRQPSYVSLHGEIIPKGSESLANYHPVIVEVVPNPTHVFENENDEQQDPRINRIRELTVMNQQRWESMGYNPSNEIFPIARAASHLALFSSDLTKRNHIQKINSFGSHNVIFDLENEDERQKKSSSTSFPLSSLSCNRQDSQETDLKQIDQQQKLFGRLSQIIEETPESSFFKVFEAERLDELSDALSIILRLRHYASITAQKIWIEETSFLNELIEKININERQKNASPRRCGFHRKNTQKDIQQLNKKHNTIIKTYQQLINDICTEENLAMNQLDKDYWIEAKKLDDLFQNPEYLNHLGKPSSELIELREKAKKLLKINKIREAQEVIQEIKNQEREETKIMQKSIRLKYHQKDKKMKETFALRKKTLIEKYLYYKNKIKSQEQNELLIIEKQIFKLKTNENMKRNI